MEGGENRLVKLKERDERTKKKAGRKQNKTVCLLEDDVRGGRLPERRKVYLVEWRGIVSL